MRIIKDLPDLVANKVITPETATAIQHYYASKKGEGTSLFTIFGALGGILVGLGIILIFAHNWDTFPHIVKVMLAFLPMLSFQVLAGYSIITKKSQAWKETSGTLLFFSVGAAIALTGQIYNIPGSTASFLMSWILVCLPLIYLLRSKALVITHLVFSTYYAVEVGYFNPERPWLYLLFLAAVVPFYLQNIKESPRGNMTGILHWMLPLSIVICLGTFLDGAQEFGLPIYIAVLSLLYNIGLLPYFRQDSLGRNGYLINGLTGITVLLLCSSFKWFWDELTKVKPGIWFIVLWIIFLGLSTAVLMVAKKQRKTLDIFSLATFIFPVIYLAGLADNLVAAILSNILILVMGILAIRQGMARFNFSALNFGLTAISALIICRFFDTNLSFAIRGLLFVAVGVGFFVTNSILLKKKRNTITTPAHEN